MKNDILHTKELTAMKPSSSQGELSMKTFIIIRPTRINSNISKLGKYK